MLRNEPVSSAKTGLMVFGTSLMAPTMEDQWLTDSINAKLACNGPKTGFLRLLVNLVNDREIALPILLEGPGHAGESEFIPGDIRPGE